MFCIFKETNICSITNPLSQPWTEVHEILYFLSNNVKFIIDFK